jgi:hypothetical protein
MAIVEIGTTAGIAPEGKNGTTLKRGCRERRGNARFCTRDADCAADSAVAGFIGVNAAAPVSIGGSIKGIVAI